jgi:putative NADH-flavin reductase
VRRADAHVDSRAHVVSGDVTDAAAIATAAWGHDAIISTLGVKNARETPTLITDTVRAVIASEKTSGVDRFVVVSAFTEFLLHTAIHGTFIRETVIVTDTK